MRGMITRLHSKDAKFTSVSYRDIYTHTQKYTNRQTDTDIQSAPTTTNP